MEGQGAYLFSQNIMRMVGDPMAVELEGDPKEQLQAKVEVIRDLLQKLEDRQKARLRAPAAAGTEGEKPAEEKPAAPAVAAGAEGQKESDFNVKNVPTRVVERTSDGNYRVKGEQPFLIKGREYKVIVTGVVRAEDFSDEGIGASKLLDPKFDIVSVKRTEANNI
jgi:flagellar L-ring protein FlgH